LGLETKAYLRWEPHLLRAYHTDAKAGFGGIDGNRGGLPSGCIGGVNRRGGGSLGVSEMDLGWAKKSGKIFETKIGLKKKSTVQK